MKKLVALLALVIAGCSGNAVKYPPGHKVGISGLVGPLDIPFGVPPYPQPGIVRFAADNSGNLIESVGGAAYSSIGGGLSAIANNTFLGNTSGISAVPTAQTTTQVLTALGITQVNDDRATVLSSAQTLVGSTLSALAFTHFNSAVDFTTTGASGGTTTLCTNCTAGVVKVATGATASHIAFAQFNGSGTQLANCRTTPFLAMFRAMWPTAADSATDANLTVSSSGNTTYQFGQHGGGSTANFWVLIRDPSGSIKVNASAGVAIDTNWHTVIIRNDLTNLVVRLDGTDVATTPVSAFSGTESCLVNVSASNNGTAANREIDLDYMGIATPPN